MIEITRGQRQTEHRQDKENNQTGRSTLSNIPKNPILQKLQKKVKYFKNHKKVYLFKNRILKPIKRRKFGICKENFRKTIEITF